MDLNLDNPSALAYWGAIEGAARDGATTAGVWDAVRNATEQMGLDSNLISFQDVNRLRAAAGGIIRSGRAFEGAGTSGPILPDYYSVAPWARDLNERNALGLYQVRVLHTTIVDGRPQQDWRSISFTGGLPADVGELKDAIEQDSQAMADQYGVEHVGVSDISILAI